MSKLPIVIFQYGVTQRKPTPNLVDFPETFRELHIPHKGQRKSEAPYWSPCTYKEGATRGAEGVESMTALVLDIDHEVESAEEVSEFWEGLEHIVYSSWSHHPEGEQRLRVVLPFKEPISPEKFKAVWTWASGIEPRADPACKDTPRLYGWPVIPQGPADGPPPDDPAKGVGEPVFIYKPGTRLDALDPEIQGALSASTPSTPSAPSATLKALYQEIATPRPPSEDYEVIRGGCAWVKHAHANADTLEEPQWYAHLSILSRCVGGREIAKALTEATPGRKRNGRFDEAWERNASRGPATCERIEGLCGDFCGACPFKGKVKSPVQVKVEVEAPTEAPVSTSVPIAPTPSALEEAKGWVENVTIRQSKLTDVEARLKADLALAKQKARHLLKYAPPDDQQGALQEVSAIEKQIAEARVLRGNLFNEAQKAQAVLRRETVAANVKEGAHPDTWAMLRKDAKGHLEKHALNFDTILRTDPVYKGKFWLDEFAMAPMFGDEPMSDTLDQRIQTDIINRYDVAFPYETIRGVVPVVSEDCKRHPVKEWLESLEWDGVARLDDLLVEGFGAQVRDDAPAEFLREMSAKFAISMVARIYEPGCKADNMLVLTGRQRAFKSTGLEALVGSKWFTDAKFDPSDKDGILILQGAWLIEVGELDSFKGRSASLIKAFLSRKVDKLRLPYGRNTVSLPRRCVIAGTTNEEEFLQDSTGDLRYYCAKVEDTVNINWIRANRTQLWAEATQRYKQGESWWFDTEESKDQLALNNRRFKVVAPWNEIVEQYVRRMRVSQISVTEILQKALEIPTHTLTADHKTRVVAILRALDFTPPEGRTTLQGQRDYFWGVPERLRKSGSPEVDDGKVVSMFRG